jgi:hypothetical protein
MGISNGSFIGQAHIQLTGLNFSHFFLFLQTAMRSAIKCLSLYSLSIDSSGSIIKFGSITCPVCIQVSAFSSGSSPFSLAVESLKSFSHEGYISLLPFFPGNKRERNIENAGRPKFRIVYYLIKINTGIAGIQKVVHVVFYLDPHSLGKLNACEN